MYTSADIFKRLQAGEAQDAIANEMAEKLNKLSEEFADALNNAIALKADAERAEQKEKREKKEDASKVAYFINKFLWKYYANLIPEGEEAITGEDFISMMDATVEISDSFANMFVHDKDSNAIDDFLKAMHLK